MSNLQDIFSLTALFVGFITGFLVSIQVLSYVFIGVFPVAMVIAMSIEILGGQREY